MEDVMQRTWAIAIVAAAATLAAGGASAATRIEIRNAAARVVVIPENRPDVKVEFTTLNPALPLTVRDDLGRVTVNGHLGRRIAGCSTASGKLAVRVRGLGQVAYDNLPQIVVRTPMDARVEASGAVFGSVGRIEALELSNAGCGDWTVANVRGALKLNQAGSGDTRAGAAGELRVNTAGSGDVIARDIAGGAILNIAGSGGVTAESISGPLHVSIAGSGDVRIAHGHATELVAHIAGSGDVRFGGEAGSVNAAVAGSGDIEVAKVNGPVKKSVLGSGDVIIGR
jgi:hypothetical protein